MDPVVIRTSYGETVAGYLHTINSTFLGLQVPVFSEIGQLSRIDEVMVFTKSIGTVRTVDEAEIRKENLPKSHETRLVEMIHGESNRQYRPAEPQPVYQEPPRPARRPQPRKPEMAPQAAQQPMDPVTGLPTTIRWMDNTSGNSQVAQAYVPPPPQFDPMTGFPVIHYNENDPLDEGAL